MPKSYSWDKVSWKPQNGTDIPARTPREVAVREVVTMLESMYKCMDLIKEHDITEEDIRNGFASKSARNSEGYYKSLYDKYSSIADKESLSYNAWSVSKPYKPKPISKSWYTEL